MWTTADLFRVVAATLSVLLGAVLVRDHRRDPSARASIALRWAPSLTWRPATDSQPRPIDVPETVRVTPERAFKGTWQLDLAPGTYKVKVRYKLADRTVESNAVKVNVPATAEASK